MKRIIRINKAGLNMLIKHRLITEQADIDEYGRKGLWKSEWNEEDQMLAMYNSLYGIEDLGLSKQEVAENIIGTSLASFNQQSSNFDFLSTGSGLDRPHEMQSSIWEKYKDTPMTEFKSICLEIIHKRLENPEEAVTNKKLGKEIGDKRDEIQKSREDALKGQGYDPQKMKLIGSRPIEPTNDEPEVSQENEGNMGEVMNFLSSMYERAKNVNTKEDARKLADDIQFLMDYISTESNEEKTISEITNLFKEKVTLSEATQKINRIIEITKKINL